MGKKRWILGFVTVLVALTTSCDFSKDNKLPSDMVNNPNSADGDKSQKMPEITFETKTHDFGKVISGEVVSYNFKFKNTGDAPLIISEVSSSCGCTVPDYPEEPIKPGEEKYLEVTFDSERRSGFQSKTITVGTNAQPSNTTLRIKAKVIHP
ncbi:MAG: DUF1573 domain-containing protein [Bacteroidales bacterium]|nr:DUF1573 domain-containing protein [Bacteroidales bacterium]